MLIEEINTNQPLPARMRPESLDEFLGQEHLVGKNSPIRKMIETDQIVSMIFWGPPGCGKTTLARIIASETNSYFIQVSAVDSGKKEIKEIIDKARNRKNFQANIFNKEEIRKNLKTILFIDEIHRFNKLQQDFLLPYVENGTITLIGATTENPSFEVISALLSRCRVFVLKEHTTDDLKKLISRTLLDKDRGLGKFNIKIEKNALDYLATGSNGDPRTCLNALELSFKLKNSKEKIIITKKDIEDALQHKALLYDKNGEEHYNIISALHKSMRSSNPDASVYWVARMLEAGEDPLYIARRMLRFASEDIGNADFRALLLANAVYEACAKVGVPECNVFLSQLAIYLAKAPKDNSAYTAYGRAKKDALDTLNQPVPLHLRNAPTSLMKDLGYSKGYIYDHDVKGKKSGQQCFPDALKNRKYLH